MSKPARREDQIRVIVKINRLKEVLKQAVLTQDRRAKNDAGDLCHLAPVR
jgi:hypothetical protein